MQVFQLHDRNPLLPYPSIVEPLLSVRLRHKKVKAAVETLPIQAFDCTVNIPVADPCDSPNRRQPWLSSIIFNHESKRRTFARSKLNHSVGSTHAASNGMSISPCTPRAQYNSPALSRITTAAAGSILCLRSLEVSDAKHTCALKIGHNQDHNKNKKEFTLGSESERGHRTLRLHFQDPGCKPCESNSRLTTSEHESPPHITSAMDSQEKELQVSGSPVLSAYDSLRGQKVLAIQSKSAPLTPRVHSNVTFQKNQPRVINLCDPAVPPLKLPLDNELRVSNAMNEKDLVISERKLRFSVPKDTYYRVRGSQTERLLRGYIPYPISVANVAYPENASASLVDANVLEPKAPLRSAKSLGSTPRSPVVLSRTIIVPAPPDSARALASQHSQALSKVKDHVVTAEMQLKGILFEAGAVSASVFNPVVCNAVPLYSGAGPKVKTNGISDKIWSRTAKIAAAADK